MDRVSIKQCLLASSVTLFLNQSYAICTPELSARIQAVLIKDTITYHIPGAQVSIFCPGEIKSRDFSSGTTILNGTTPIQNKHLFQVGSETKSLIAVIMLKLEAQGVLSIQDKIGSWLPFLPTAWQDISIKQLLNHTSGIYNYTDVLEELGQQGKLDLYKQWQSQELLDLVKDKSLYFPPGQGWHYSNTNYVLAGLIIEKATGLSVDELIQRDVLWPLGMYDTYYLPEKYDDKIMQRIAHGYSARGVFPDEPKDITETNHSYFNAAGALVSSSHDMAIWIKRLLLGGLLPSKQMHELMNLVDENTGKHIPHTSSQLGYGLGLVHDTKTFGEEAWWHSGSTLGYSSVMIWLVPDSIYLSVNISHITAAEFEQRDIYQLTNDIVTEIKTSH